MRHSIPFIILGTASFAISIIQQGIGVSIMISGDWDRLCGQGGYACYSLFSAILFFMISQIDFKKAWLDFGSRS